ncbi:site-specific DNA-methyltransferase [Pusillimonas minor]|uniref:site-specific DNA-methyltransferase (adenine-specific) n=1 Tax=Pusillimonas minor TaxID=2697024 RepID=A0A842HM19_9BURK|nr:site-specific DNA-methyltransferase [Pusillimonas minor]MBC2768792.1 site-specific DNA-methyltransferase [Pusillimonas minor]
MPSLNWIGKEAVVKHHKDVPFRLLEPMADLSCGPAQGKDSGNLIVQGDNLHALKALLPRYAGKVKCIYIDPPYNTGNEGWVYNDNVNSPEILKWLGEVVGKEGETLDRHDRWLSMMYPRLVLLKQFLDEDGVIFVSIDDDEVHHLRSLMDELFGTRRRLATFVWRTDGNFDNQAKIKNCHEYVLAYANNPDLFPHPSVVDPSIGKESKLNRLHIQNTIVKNGPKNPVSSIELPAGFPASIDAGVIRARSNQWPHYATDVNIVDGKLATPVTVSSGWSSKSILQNFIDSNFESVLDSKGQRTRFVVTGTGAIESVKDREQASHVITVIGGVGSTQSQSSALAEMGFAFPFPKPVDLVRYLVSMIQGNDFIVLDSFAGSGTTAHAVLKLNAEDGGNRRFILVEMDDNISRNVTRERIKRVAEGYSNAKNQAVEGLGGGFQFCSLSAEPLFNADGQIRSDVKFAQLAEFVWFAETGTGFTGTADSPLLGVHEGRAIYLLYNGILKDKSVGGGNVLTGPVFDVLPKFAGSKVIYAAANRMGARTAREGIVFKQTPYALEV